MNEKHLDPSVSLLEQIDDQYLDANGGSTFITTQNPMYSLYLGNTGYFCTVSVECQQNGC